MNMSYDIERIFINFFIHFGTGIILKENQYLILRF
jgi:hypothetical protein